jgi:hypothetical protein
MLGWHAWLLQGFGMRLAVEGVEQPAVVGRARYKEGTQ